MSKKNKTLKKIQEEIDRLDSRIAELLSERLKKSDEALTLKKKAGTKLIDERREAEIISRLKSERPDQADFLEKIYRAILSRTTSRYVFRNKYLFEFGLSEAIEVFPLIIAGPCSVESEESVARIAEALSNMGVRFLRGGTFKPRTSPKSFQGLGDKGIEFIRKAADKYDMFVVTETLETESLKKHYDKIDVLQIGSRSMSAYGYLKEVGRLTAKDGKPVLLKRGFAATVKEFLNAAEYILEAGNPNVILCLRGTRTFEQIDSNFRFSPDLAALLELKERTKLKVLFDPSHSSGNAKYVSAIAKAAMVLGADGLLVETHYDPAAALSDAKQTISLEEFEKILLDL